MQGEVSCTTGVVHQRLPVARTAAEFCCSCASGCCSRLTCACWPRRCSSLRLPPPGRSCTHIHKHDNSVTRGSLNVSGSRRQPWSVRVHSRSCCWHGSADEPLPSTLLTRHCHRSCIRAACARQQGEERWHVSTTYLGLPEGCMHTAGTSEHRLTGSRWHAASRRVRPLPLPWVHLP